MLTLSARHLEAYPQQDSEQSWNYTQLKEKYLQRTLSTLPRAFGAQGHLKQDANQNAKQDAILATSFLLCFYSCSNHDFNPSATIPCEDLTFTFALGIRSIVIDNIDLAHSGALRELVTLPGEFFLAL